MALSRRTPGSILHTCNLRRLNVLVYSNLALTLSSDWQEITKTVFNFWESDIIKLTLTERIWSVTSMTVIKKSKAEEPKDGSKI